MLIPSSPRHFLKGASLRGERDSLLGTRQTIYLFNFRKGHSLPQDPRNFVLIWFNLNVNLLQKFYLINLCNRFYIVMHCCQVAIVECLLLRIFTY